MIDMKEIKRKQMTKDINVFVDMLNGCVNRMCVTGDPKELREKHAHAVMYLYQLLYMLHIRLQEDGHDNEQR